MSVNAYFTLGSRHSLVMMFEVMSYLKFQLKCFLTDVLSCLYMVGVLYCDCCCPIWILSSVMTRVSLVESVSVAWHVFHRNGDEIQGKAETISQKKIGGLWVHINKQSP